MLKKIGLILLVGFISFQARSQDYGNNLEALALCTTLQGNNFSTDYKAEKALQRILDAIGASKRFVLQPCNNINNALAVTYNGVRYILYDPVFMKGLDSGNDWGNIFILAHEVGHHINGHSVDLALLGSEILEPKTLSQKRQQEIEADEFASFVVTKLGGAIYESENVISEISENYDDTFSSHPSKNKRIEAIRRGYQRANENVVSTYSDGDELESVELYFLMAVELFVEENYSDALEYLDLVIDLSPEFEFAYFTRGVAKGFMQDYDGSIMDLDKAIVINPNLAEAYFWRARSKGLKGDKRSSQRDFKKGFSLEANSQIGYRLKGEIQMELGNIQDAIKEFSRGLKFHPSSELLHQQRGLCYAQIGKYDEALADITQLININPNDAYLILRGDINHMQQDYTSAIIDYTMAITMNPDNGEAYFGRGKCYAALEIYDSSCEDLYKAESLGFNEIPSFIMDICNNLYPDIDNEALEWFKLGKEEMNIENYNMALFYFDKAIELNSENADFYVMRAMVKMENNELFEALDDLDLALKLDSKNEAIYFLRGSFYVLSELFYLGLNDFNKAIELNSDIARFYIGRGICKIAIGDLDGAIMDLDQSIILDDSNPQAYLQRGITKYRIGDLFNACEDFYNANLLGSDDVHEWLENCK